MPGAVTRAARERVIGGPMRQAAIRWPLATGTSGLLVFSSCSQPVPPDEVALSDRTGSCEAPYPWELLGGVVPSELVEGERKAANAGDKHDHGRLRSGCSRTSRPDDRGMNEVSHRHASIVPPIVSTRAECRVVRRQAAREWMIGAPAAPRCH